MFIKFFIIFSQSLDLCTGAGHPSCQFLKAQCNLFYTLLSCPENSGSIRKPVFKAHLLSKIINFKSTPLIHSDNNCETVFQVKILTLFHLLEKESQSSEEE